MRRRLAALLIGAVLVASVVAGQVEAAAGPVRANELARERSPYLRDSAHSPVWWIPWGEGQAPDARAGDKLVFLSIGYSSCHWCHVMARESFDDPGVAALLNRGFVSVKVDSEERPDLDGRFLARLEALGISPGWPMNFVLTPQGEVIWGATYIGRDKLVATLERLAARWKTDPARLRRLAAARERQVSAAEAPRQDAVPVADAYSRQTARIAGEFDPVHKGFGTGNKFPAAAELGYLHGAYLRGAGVEYGRMFVDTVRAIASGGLHDPIDGGVFRYSTSRDWLQPHFEKMLNDQAQVARLLCQAHGISGDPALARDARGTLDFVLRAFQTEDGLLASSFNAASGGVEGGYYLWSAADFERLPITAREGVASGFREVPLAGRILLVPNALDEDPPAAALEALRALRKAKPMPRRDDKAITAWNANMVAALAECGTRLRDSRYAAEAAARMRLLLDANAPAGSIHRYSIAGERAGAGTIDDAAWLLAALVSLHDADGSEEWVGHAGRLLRTFLAVDGAALQRGLDDFARDRGAPAPSAMLLDAVSRLARRSEDAVFRSAVDRFVPMLRSRAGNDGFASVTAALREIEVPVPRPVVHAAQGKVRLSLGRARATVGEYASFEVVADVRDGWHINSHEPGQDYLRPTRITVGGVEGYEVHYPAAKPMRFGPTGDMLSVLEGRPCFGIRLPSAAGELAGPVRLAVTVQACNDRVCLRPETVDLADPSWRDRLCSGAAH